jgi:N-acetylmuramoyl-L-alanine amidase
VTSLVGSGQVWEVSSSHLTTRVIPWSRGAAVCDRHTPIVRSIPLLLVLGGMAVSLVLGGDSAASGTAASKAPEIVSEPIPFSAKRRQETAAYSRRHYGIAEWRLIRPQVIVEHYTASTTFSSAYWTFVSNAPDRELHETPGICAHFIIDTDGTIYQLVSTSIRCRHTVGLNWTAIGIEHVGVSDADVLGNRAQMRSSLALTAWLMGRFGIALGNVIGHNESLSSPYRRERYAAWRCQTHADFPTAAMDVYRARLRPVLARMGVPTGPAVKRAATTC